VVIKKITIGRTAFWPFALLILYISVNYFQIFIGQQWYFLHSPNMHKFNVTSLCLPNKHYIADINSEAAQIMAMVEFYA
jgi:hypothetical protein